MVTFSDSTKHNSHARSSQKKSMAHLSSLQPVLSPKVPRLCEKSPKAIFDIIMLILILGACGLLFTPYFKYIFAEAAEVLPLALIYIGEAVYEAPFAHISAALLAFMLVIGGLEIYEYRSRKCDNPKCRGLRKAVEFDIQLESEGCITSLSSLESPTSSENSSSNSCEVPWKGSVELGHGHKELEAKLKKMAPPNGRAVLVFRYPCGCPAAHMAVEASKKPRRSKK